MRFLLALCVAAALIGAPQSKSKAAQISCAGILGNSGEQGRTLIRFGNNQAFGAGVAFDDTGSLWDRGGDGVLNRYALDGRLLAAYKIPASHSGLDGITRVGNILLIALEGKLFSLPLDAAPGSVAAPLGVSADLMSLQSVDGSVAIAAAPDRRNWTISLFTPATNKKAPLLDHPVTGLRQLELMPSHGLMAEINGSLHWYENGKEVTEGWPRPGPGGRFQLIDGFWFGSGGHGTIRRFNSEMEPEPGVVLGGGSGAFIGHVDGNHELDHCRGLAKLRGDLFAASGISGILHLLRWDKDRQQFVIIRRIGAIPSCQGLGINRQGQVWFNWGYWNWNDRPDGFLHDTTGAGPSRDGPGIGQLVMLPNDNFVAPEVSNRHAVVIGGPFSWKITFNDLKTPSTNAGFVNGSAVYAEKGRMILLAINASGKGQSYRIDNSGKVLDERGPVTLETTPPVKEWTSLALKNNDTLLGAGDGFVIEMNRDGDNWKETRRWNTWKAPGATPFGERIYIAADAGNLWVSDTERHRVLCFSTTDNALRAAFGAANQAGDDLSHLTGPRTLAARESRAVVFDSGNQRLVKLALSE